MPVRRLRDALTAANTPDNAILKAYFDVNFGPFDRLEDDKPFINTGTHKPEGANYYPADMTKTEFEEWVTNHPEDADVLRGFLPSFAAMVKNCAVPFRGISGISRTGSQTAP
ncbi:MAG: hypothetical protein R3C26_09665 [Calditrichia bacterium]